MIVIGWAWVLIVSQAAILQDGHRGIAQHTWVFPSQAECVAYASTIQGNPTPEMECIKSPVLAVAEATCPPGPICGKPPR